MSRIVVLLLLVGLASSIAPSNWAAGAEGGDGSPIRDDDPGSRAHYRSSSWASMPPLTTATTTTTTTTATTTSKESQQRVDAVLGNRTHLSPAELASAAPSILPPGMIHKGLKDDEVYRILRNFVVQNKSSGGDPLPQKPSPSEVSAALARAAAENWLTRPVLLSLAGNTSGAFMALADVSQGGVVNKEHEYNAWSARDDPFFDVEDWSGGNGSSSPLIPASIDRAFDRADWTADQRRGINASAAERLGFGDRVSELFLTMDQGGGGAGDGRLSLEELSERMPADTPLPANAKTKRHPVYMYTPENGEKLARALLRAFDADSDSTISRKEGGGGEEAAGVVEALAALRAGEGPRSCAGRRLIAALVLGDGYSPAASLGEKAVAAYARRARETGEMAVSPPSEADDAAVARWFVEKANGGRKSSRVEDFVALADGKKSG